MTNRSIYVTGDRLKGQCQLFFLKQQKNAAIRIHQINLSFGPAGIYQCKRGFVDGTQAGHLKTALAARPKLSLPEAAALLQDAWVMNQVYRRLPPAGINWLYNLLDMNTESVNRRQLLYKLTSLPKDPEFFLRAYLEAMIRQDWAFCYDLSTIRQQEKLGLRPDYLSEQARRHSRNAIIKVNIVKEGFPSWRKELNNTAGFRLQLFWHDENEDVWFGEYFVQTVLEKNESWLLSEFKECSCVRLSSRDPLHPSNTLCTCNVFYLTKRQHEQISSWLRQQPTYYLSGESDYCLIYQTPSSPFRPTGVHLALLENELWLYSDNPDDLKKALGLIKKCLGKSLSCLGKGKLPLSQIEESAAAGISLKPYLLSTTPETLVFDLDNLRVSHL